MSEKWSVCCTRRGNPCLYTERSREKIEDRRADGGPAYCIKHGEELQWAHRLYGMTREDARKWLCENPERELCY